jgi:soluble lytic murein transglycosylase-like protein
MAPVRADIFSFEDESGTVHYSNVPSDGRYQLLIRAVAEGTRAGEYMTPERVIANAQQFERLIDATASATKVESALLKAVIAVESGYNARAVSRAGARGLMQLMPATARRYGATNVFDPAQNVRAGARYLRDLLHRYSNDLELTLAAYNAGEAAVEKHGRAIPPYAETRRYVPRVIALYRSLALLHAPAAAGFAHPVLPGNTPRLTRFSPTAKRLDWS